MKDKNFLLVISKFPPEYSGPGVRIPRIYDWLEEKGDKVNLQVLCNGVEQVKNETYDYKGYLVRRVTAEYLGKFNFLPKRLLSSLIYQYEFLKTLFILFSSNSYKTIDFLHVAGHSGGTAASLVWAKMNKTPVLMELVTEHARHKQKFLWVFKIKPHINSKIIALTEKTKIECINLGLNEDQIWCRPNPINEIRFYPEFDEKYSLRKKLTPFNENQNVIVNVAKIMPQKNQFLILEALALLPDNYVAVIAGPFVKKGPLYDRDKKYIECMNEYISYHNLSARVELILDFVNAEEYMKLGDVYAMPAWNEGFGTPMMEAISCGTPVVANAEEIAFQEWIKDGENGFLCDIKKPDDWVQAIEKSVKFSEEQRLKMSEEIHKKAGQKVIYSHYETIIKTLLDGVSNNGSSTKN